MKREMAMILMLAAGICARAEEIKDEPISVKEALEISASIETNEENADTSKTEKPNAVTSRVMEADGYTYKGHYESTDINSWHTYFKGCKVDLKGNVQFITGHRNPSVVLVNDGAFAGFNVCVNLYTKESRQKYINEILALGYKEDKESAVGGEVNRTFVKGEHSITIFFSKRPPFAVGFY